MSVLTAEERISHALAKDVQRTRSLSGGCIADVRLAELADGSRVVAKIAPLGSASNLDLEGWMLDQLRERSSLPVPLVLHAASDLLILEYIEASGPITRDVQLHAAELLAALHSITTDRYGLERDTLIGPLNQPNGWMEDWRTFYADRRLMAFGRIALERRGIDAGAMRSIERVCANLPTLIPEPNPPSLIHGDVWGGNVLCAGGRVAAFIDPAIYFADAEIELAFTTLFSTFGEAFFERYNELRPLRPGFFETRREVYLLYPLLVHAALFGPSYGEQVRAICERFG